MYQNYKQPQYLITQITNNIMATLVKFLLDDDREVFAYFPQLNYNKSQHGNSLKTCYAHVGQHSACQIDYITDLQPATKSEYSELLEELKGIGYDCKVLNKGFRIEQCTLPAFWGSPLINNDYSGCNDEDIEQINSWLGANKPGLCTQVSEETNFSQFEGIGHDVAEFTFIKY